MDSRVVARPHYPPARQYLFQFHWMDSDSVANTTVSISATNAFNSIEWILETLTEHIDSILMTATFNSIEWILLWFKPPWSSGYQAVPFNSIEWIPCTMLLGTSCPWRCSFQFHWMDSKQECFPFARLHYSFYSFNSIEWILGTSINYASACVSYFLSIPLNGFHNTTGFTVLSTKTIFLSIPLNGFFTK